MQNRSSERSGFSLIEMLLSIGIFAVAASITVGDVVDGVTKHRLNGVKSTLIQDLRTARSNAVNQNLHVRVTFLNELDQYAIWTDLDRDGVVDIGESEQYMLDPEVNMWCYPEQGTFSPKGTFACSNSYCYVSVQTPSGYESLLLTPNGHVGNYSGVSP